LTAFSRKKRRSSEEYRGSCEPIAEGEFKLVEAEQREECRGIGTRLGPFLLLNEYEPPKAMPYNLVTVPTILFLTFIFALNYVRVSTCKNLLAATTGFFGGLIIPFSIQIIVTDLLSRLDGVSVSWLLFPVPSPLPTALLSTFPSRPYSSRGKASLAQVAGLIAGSLTALILAQWTQEIMEVYPKVSGQSLVYYPFIFFLTGFLNPIASGAFAYTLSALFQLLPYPYSVGWYLGFPRALSLLPITLWLGLRSNPPASEIYAPLTMITLILSMFEAEQPISDPWEGSRLSVALAALAIILLSPVPH